MKIRIKRTILTLSLIALGFMVSLPYHNAARATKFFGSHDELAQENLTIKKADGDELLFTVEIAATPRQQAKGLMNRTYLAENSGMLFVFGSSEPRSFWMRNTLIPLDMLFIDKNGVVNHIHHMAKPLDETRITSGKPAFAVLELKGGTADRLNIKAGDKVFHDAFRNVHLNAPVDAPAGMSMDPSMGENDGGPPRPSIDSLLAE